VGFTSLAFSSLKRLVMQGHSMDAAEKGLKAHTMWNPRKGGYRAAMFIFGK